MKTKRSPETESIFEMIRQTIIDKNITDVELCETVKLDPIKFNKMLSGKIQLNAKFL